MNDQQWGFADLLRSQQQSTNDISALKAHLDLHTENHLTTADLHLVKSRVSLASFRSLK